VNSRFRKSFNGPRLSAEQAQRQGQVSSAAFLSLGQAGAIAFLNGHDDGLGARPLDLAIESDEGLAAVQQLIARRKAAAE